jgi:hypothetical protein
MKNISKTGWLLLIAVALNGNTRTYGQLGELGNMMAGGTEDARKLLQPYITPAVNAFGAALAGGWYNTAEPHKLGGFDITITANASIVPQKYRTFAIDNDDLTYLKLAPSENNEAQTVSGEKITGPQIVYNVQDGNGNVIYSQPAFRMPQGLNTQWIPAPMLQVGIGLIKGTDVIFRFVPNVSVKQNEAGLWGIGGRHDIKQWIPGVKRLPILKMSIMYGYTKLHTFVHMNIDKNTIGVGSLEGPETWDNQSMKIWVQSQTANLLLAADLKVITFYGGFGFVTTKTNLKLEGDFPTVTIPTGEFEPVVVAMTDPLELEIKNQDGGITKPRFNAGVRLKLAVVTLHFDYSWANYSVLTAGLGISWR